MAGLVPAIPILDTRRVRQFYVDIPISCPGGALYVGVTSNLVRTWRDLYDDIATP